MDLGYLNSRVRVWKAGLLSRSFIVSLLQDSDLNTFVKRLEATDYASDIVIAKSIVGGAPPSLILHTAFKKHISRTYAMLRKSSPPSSAFLFESIAAPFEIMNIKAVIRGISANIDHAELFSLLVPTWSFDAGALSELVEQSDIRKMISLLDTWGSHFAKPLINAYNEYLKLKRLYVLEASLDRYVVRFCMDKMKNNCAVGRVVKSVLSQRIDAWNLSSAFKIVSEGGPPPEASLFYLRGGTISEAVFSDLIKSANLSLLGEKIAEIPFFRGRTGRLAHRGEMAGLYMIETVSSSITLKYLLKLSVVEPLGMALPIYILYAKYAEIERLRLIVSSLRFSIPHVKVKQILDMYE